MRDVRLRINTYGRSAKDGDGVFKVVHGERHLVKTGWRVVRRGGGAAFLRAPAPDSTARPVVAVAVPTKDEALARAVELHRAKASWEGALGDWAAWYAPHAGASPAAFRVGDDAVWSIHVAWDKGDDASPAVTELDANIVTDVPPGLVPAKRRS